ncbi:MAG: prepilin peptidase [Acidobacteria bacterium]|nr:prepilin peptidase [Acidobacteriota bacterium]
MTPETFFLVVAGLFGLLVGSFLNVCIFRLPRGTSIVWPASACGSCKRELRWFENIPIVSWVVLGAKCARCKAPISIQYPLVEAITAVLFVLVTATTPAGPQLAAHLLFVCALIVLFGIDLEHQILPNSITLPGIVIGVLFSLVGPPGWRASLLGVLLGGGVLYAIAWGYYAVRREEGLGMGDVKMLGMIGAFLGWQAVLLTLVLASLSGAVIGVAMISLQRGSMKYALPFGTFLAIGALVAMLAGQPIIDWYVGFY